MTEKLEMGTSETRLGELARSAGADIIVSGHSHRPMYRRCGKVRFLNPGSVGRQVDGNPRASYALLSMRPLRVSLRRVDYDLEMATRAIRERGRPEWLAQALHRARAEPSEARKDLESRFLQTTKVYRSYLGEDAHTEQVIRLSTMLFGCMAGELGLGTKDLFLLRCAAALHDIGWTEGGPGHHKMSLRMIMEDYDLPFDPKERRMVAAVARYHRKAQPKGSHALVSTMGRAERRRLEALASLLRLADGLDSSHGGKVRRLGCEVTSDKIILRCDVTGPIEMEERDAHKKGDLIQMVLGRSLEIHWDVG
jgi:exopolyphosphatase/guanosine-5'-triphosphate,3'-diphosphate pyrophosphatase